MGFGSSSASRDLVAPGADLAACRDRLRMAGADFQEPPPGHEGFTEIVTHDPDGNRLRLFAWE